MMKWSTVLPGQVQAKMAKKGQVLADLLTDFSLCKAQSSKTKALKQIGVCMSTDNQQISGQKRRSF